MDKRNFDNHLKPISKISRGWKPLPQCIVTVWERHLAAICEHFKEAHDAPWFNKIDANPASRGNTAIGRLPASGG
jgi:hypothetical protein